RSAGVRARRLKGERPDPTSDPRHRGQQPVIGTDPAPCPRRAGLAAARVGGDRPDHEASPQPSRRRRSSGPRRLGESQKIPANGLRPEPELRSSVPFWAGAKPIRLGGTMASAEQTPATVLDQLENAVLDEEASLAVRRYLTIPGRDPF